ncbi:PREDICTED: uncharacterized protein LOC106146422 [Chinchilla lanigera]|uniref:uncharacterized protein LOC106146422 n=1 Tax=Chinchilla lanigera TaxID=34839 RepID=UPI0006973990|nr:PREDICTED: uncharacterized protein LOC106146422 [Chinchilla lanigera]
MSLRRTAARETSLLGVTACRVPSVSLAAHVGAFPLVFRFCGCLRRRFRRWPLGGAAARACWLRSSSSGPLITPSVRPDPSSQPDFWRRLSGAWAEAPGAGGPEGPGPGAGSLGEGPRLWGVQWAGRLPWDSRGEKGLYAPTSELGRGSSLCTDTQRFLGTRNFTKVDQFNPLDNSADPNLQPRTLRNRLLVRCVLLKLLCSLTPQLLPVVPSLTLHTAAHGMQLPRIRASLLVRSYFCLQGSIPEARGPEAL